MLAQQVNGQPLIYLDNAATVHKPRQLVQRLEQLYLHEYAKPDEEHPLSQRITEAVQATRQQVATLINAAPEEVVFVRSTTEAINLVAQGFGRNLLREGDEVIISILAHHSNCLPWQQACELAKARLTVLPITPSGELDLDQLAAAITPRTRLLAIEHSSHVLATLSPVREIVKLAHARGVAVLVDGAQTAPHMPIDMRELDCDFYCFSAHKMGGPAGVGVLYGRQEWLKKLPVFQSGSDMASEVVMYPGQPGFLDFVPKPLPKKFEAGTSAFVDIIAFGAVISYLEGIGRQQIADYEQQLLHYATALFERRPDDRVRILGSAPEKEPLISFTVAGMSPQQVASFFNEHTGIALRGGDLSAQPLMKFLGIEGAVRISFGFYNTYQEIDTFMQALDECLRQHKG